MNLIQSLKLTDEEYNKNFQDINPPLNDDNARTEANRCIYCYDAPCTKACPTNIDVASFIKKIATSNLSGSARVILEANILGYSCSRVCPVDILCEGACVYNDKKEKPIAIALLQRYATDYVYNKGIHKILFQAGKCNGIKIGIIGAGPAGLSCAAEAAQRGYAVTIYDKKPLSGGLNTYGIARYKMPVEYSLKEVDFIKSLGIKFINNCTVGKDISIPELLNQYAAIFIGIGLGETEILNIPGEDLPGVYDALGWIEHFKSPSFREIDIGNKVAVIGGGNTAIDACIQAKRLGAESVYMLYRRSSNEMPAYHYEYELAKKDEIIFLWLTAPIRILGDNHVTGLECIKMKLGEPDSSGRCSPIPLKGSEFILEIDMIIKSVGRNKYIDFISQFPLIKTDAKGLIQVNPVTLQTANSKIFAGGDCINGGKEVVNAVRDGKQAAIGIEQYFNHIIK